MQHLKNSQNRQNIDYQTLHEKAGHIFSSFHLTLMN